MGWAIFKAKQLCRLGAIMAQIIVTPIDEYNFQVNVIAHSSTTHKVSIQPDYVNKLTAGRITNTQLVEKSFEFLLERESNTSILRSFDLSVIARYFPEYETIISR
jgi:hypothetical protein